MRILQLTVIIGCLLSPSFADETWSWSSKKDDKSIDKVKIQKRSDNVNNNNQNHENKTIEETHGRNFYNDHDIYSNETTVDDVVDTILFSSREGRALDGDYDQVYTDPGVQEALAKGDDIQARNLIKEKLCSLGLMSCDGTQDGPEGKRPLYSNIYAQGPPPQRRPGGPPYGPPRPMPPPSKFHGPPRKVGYVGARPLGPSYQGPYLDAQENSLSFSKPPPGAIIYGSKPPGPVYTGGDAPYNFEHIVGDKIHVEDDHHHNYGNSFSTHSLPFGSSSPESFASGSFNQGSPFGGPTALHHSKPVIVPNALESATSSASNLIAAASTASLQQHVHHHFHHVNDGAAALKPTVVTVPVPVPVLTGNGIGGQFGGSQSAGGFTPTSSEFSGGTLGSAAFNAGFNSAAHGGIISGSTGFGGVNSGYKPSGNSYASSASIKPVSESGLGNYGSSVYAQSLSNINNGNTGSFHSINPDYYKKELQSGSQSQQYNGLGTYAQQNKYTSSLSQFGAQNQYQSLGANQYQASAGGDAYQGFETARQQNVDCVCVPINQCPASDRIGRKEDLILPIDPRNLGSNIEAVNDDITNSTSTNSNEGAKKVKREAKSSSQNKQADDIDDDDISDTQARQSYFGGHPTGGFKQCGSFEVCCRTPYRPPQQQQLGHCGTRNAHGITGRIKNPVYVDGDSEYGEYPWQVAILKKDPKESVYVCGGTVIDHQHIITAAHCVKTYQGFDLRVRLGEWDVNHDVEFYPYIERDIISVTVHPEYYAGTLDNDLAILRMDQPIDFNKNPHISPACLPEKFSDFTGARCWTTGWGKDAFGDFGKYQNILKEVDVPIIDQQQCQNQLRHTRLGYNYKLNPGFICAGGEEGKDACKGDGGGPMVCERNGIWQLVGVVSWGIGCGQVNVPGVYVRVSYYLDWINQITRY